MSGFGRPAAPGSEAVARHACPELDEAALAAARDADRLLAGARAAGMARWVAFLEPIPDRLRDDGPADLGKIATRARAAYGPKDSIREGLPASVTEPFLGSLDRLLRVLARAEVER